MKPILPNPHLNRLGIAAAAGVVGYGIWQYWKNQLFTARKENNMTQGTSSATDGPFPFGEMRSEHGQNISLKSVAISGKIDGLFFGWTIRQEYKNETNGPLEIIYTFPLGWNAALLGMEATIGEKKLSGVVVEKNEAEKKYEKAISDGDSAIMVQQSARGLYTANLGNIAKDETVVVELSCARLLNFEQGHARLCIPTVIGERYGDPHGPGGLAAHESAMVDAAANYSFSLELTLSGDVAGGEIICPSHTVNILKENGQAVVKLSDAVLDRDFILLMKGVNTASHALYVPDGDEYMLAASFQPVIPHKEISPVALKILVDCSGSMMGSSIEEARKGLAQILRQLRPEDYVSYSRFGSNVKHATKSLVPCDADGLKKLSAAIESTAADMGGTEMEGALKSTFKLASPADDELPPMVLLITDGDVWQTQNIVKAAKEAGHRIFVVGVGFAPGEHVIRDMAEETGGACELANPNENIADVIIRMFNSMRGTIARNIRIEWPEKPMWKCRLPNYIYDGETVHAFALVKNRPQTSPLLRWQADGAECEAKAEHIEATNNFDLARLGHARQIEECRSAREKQEIALKYQLVGEKTSLILVYEREDKINEPLKIRQVPQMPAHGHGCAAAVGIACHAFPPILGCIAGGMRGISDLDFAEQAFQNPTFIRKQKDSRPQAVDGTGKISVDAAALIELWKTNLFGEGSMQGFISAVEAEDKFAQIVEAVDEIADTYGVPAAVVWALLVEDAENWLASNCGQQKERHSTRLLKATLKNVSATDAELLETAIDEKFELA